MTTHRGGRPKSELTADKRDEIIALIKSGASYRAAARTAGVSRWIAHQIAKEIEPEATMIKDSYQITFDLIVIERPKPLPVLAAWRSMPIPPAKTCQWCEPGSRPRTWIFCDDPNVVPGKSYCGPHYERSIEPALEAVA